MAHKKEKMSQGELLEALCEAPFNQRKCVPHDAIIENSPQERWWRSDSPRAGDDQYPDAPIPPNKSALSGTRGVLGAGQRTGPGLYVSSSQTGSGSAAHFKEEGLMQNISGYSGHIPGKYAGNCVGTTFDRSSTDAKEHLKTTSQVERYGALANR
mmetsp:Transcript_13550/g.21550  ORF Transcript_13550/g.21550 Transcript_13550/m.21550 type:complete len:155 (+) Transcript_13550:64-528(+)